MGDIYATADGDVVDPDEWGWVQAGGKKDHAELRRPLESLAELPGFRIEVADGPTAVPGARTRGSSLENPVDGHAPPAVLESRDGIDGTRAYFNRLSDAVGKAPVRLLADPSASPMVIHDLVNGRTIRVFYEPTLQPASDAGTVYIIEDGFGIKIGHTTGVVAKRIAGLQTGNSRPISPVAEIHGAPVAVEEHLHSSLAAWSLRGEWFDRAKLMAQATNLGGVEPWLRNVLGDGDWLITVHSPYR